MRDQLYEFDRYFVTIRLGFDAHCMIDTPKDGYSRNLLEILPVLIERGLDAPPYKRWAPDGTADERRSLSVVTAFLGTDGSIVVYKKRSIDMKGFPTNGVPLSDGEAVNVITNGLYALTETDPDDDVEGVDAETAADGDVVQDSDHTPEDADEEEEG